jgi:lipid II:glycine glycyltransferase (peptidoglycan interpeptide bridge formation enzyme)
MSFWFSFLVSTLQYVINRYSNFYDSVIITIFYLRLYKANQDLKVLLIATNNRMNEMMEKVDARMAKVDEIAAKQNALMEKIEDLMSTATNREFIDNNFFPNH